MMSRLLAIVLILFIYHLPFHIVAVGSPASAQSPSNIDWSSLDNLLEIPSPEIQPSTISHEQEYQPHAQNEHDFHIQAKPVPKPKKKVKIRYPETVLKAYQGYVKRLQNDPEYAKRRKAQKKSSNSKA
ncbi:uncharacterized protein FA14DRAFT_64936 [Meira miltonrushii]|uniref:Uncharacterized protein n=1 Tax=Meira miltonrushii TaxID=1280837 RepID=A0A316V915_9BASI|nr:uncharacterized protein FA14DRAFT_64936 [Meira miltonrushii]PWN33734.1 hypothetical protein FA14DRAFT_64936 [Meira miltonrushii]